jgi:hypothetical protein
VEIVAGLTRRFSGLLHLYRDAERRNSRRRFCEFGGVPRLWLSRGRGLVAVWLDCPSGQRNRSGRYTAAAKLENRPYRGRGAWGSDPRPLRLTMDGLLDRTCGERPRASRIGIVPRSDLPDD